MDSIAQAKSILKQVWGFDSFRSGQESIVKSVLEQKNTIAILPTGSGKSIGYQLPAPYDGWYLYRYHTIDSTNARSSFKA